MGQDDSLEKLGSQTQGKFIAFQRVLIRRHGDQKTSNKQKKEDVGTRHKIKQSPSPWHKMQEVIRCCWRKTQNHAHFLQNMLLLEQKSQATGEGQHTLQLSKTRQNPCFWRVRWQEENISAFGEIKEHSHQQDASKDPLQMGKVQDQGCWVQQMKM